MKRKTKTPEGIKHILNKVIKRIERGWPGKKEEILNVWQKVVGERASCHSRPVSIRRKVLTIEIDSSTWFYELNLKKRGILKDIKKELGGERVEDIRFRMGDIE